MRHQHLVGLHHQVLGHPAVQLKALHAVEHRVGRIEIRPQPQVVRRHGLVHQPLVGVQVVGALVKEVRKHVVALQPRLQRQLVVAVAGKHLVAALARQHHGHVLADALAQPRQRKTGRVGDRLVELRDHRVHAAAQLVAAHADLDIVQVEVARHLARELELVDLRKADAVGLEPGASAVHIGGNRAGVQPAAEQHADRHLAHQLRLHRLAQQLVQLVDVALLGAGVIGMRLVQADIGKTADLADTAAQLQHAARRQFSDAQKLGVRRQVVAVGQVVLKPHRVQGVVQPRQAQQCAQLGRKGDAVGVLVDIERLGAKAVTRQQKRAVVVVPHTQRKHAVELGQAGVALGQHGGQHGLGVGLGGKRVAGLQRLAQCLPVVDLAVVDDAACCIGRVDRLVATAAVDDGQPQVGVDRPVGAVGTKGVRPAVLQAARKVRRRLVQHAAVHGLLEVNACNPAHVVTACLRICACAALVLRLCRARAAAAGRHAQQKRFSRS